MTRELYLIIDNVRSSENIGSILRTADGLSINEVLICGYSPYPIVSYARDTRLPHIANKIDRKIHKTALGAEKTQFWKHYQTTTKAVLSLRARGIKIIGLEQQNKAIPIYKYHGSDKVAIVVGNEIDGIDSKIINLCDQLIEIPMLGKKESYNVAIASAMAMFYFRYCDIV